MDPHLLSHFGSAGLEWPPISPLLPTEMRLPPTSLTEVFPPALALALMRCSDHAGHREAGSSIQRLSLPAFYPPAPHQRVTRGCARRTTFTLLPRMDWKIMYRSEARD